MGRGVAIYALSPAHGCYASEVITQQDKPCHRYNEHTTAVVPVSLALFLL